MGKIILFSPIGGTDPISNTNCQDGALIHICRVYKPDEMYLYMSKYIIDNEQKDHRYSYCLEKLYENLDKDLNCHWIERPELDEVQDFDYFYDEYLVILDEIAKGMSQDDRLIINVSSGTPAMKSALLVLASMGRVDADVIQVVTPVKGINEHNHKNYEVDALWELNPDNEDGFENRCRELNCSSLASVQTEALVKKLVDSYDYKAALDVAKTIPERYTSEYIYLLEYAKDRLLSDFRSANKLAKEYQIPSFLTVANMEQRKIVEYALNLEVKYRKGEYADFIRAFTPLVLNLLVLIVKKYLKVNVLDFCDNRNGYRWNKKKIQQNATTAEWLPVWEVEYRAEFQFSYLKTDHLVCLIVNYVNDDSIKSTVRLLRDVEEKVRNTAAHEISTITEERIKQDTGYSCDEIINAVRKSFTYTSIGIQKSDWSSYDAMNEYIIDHIDSRK